MCISATSLSPASFLLHTLPFFDRFGGDGGGVFDGVCGLDAGGRRGDRSPCLATRHAQRYGATSQQCQHNRLDDFVPLFVCHNA